MQSRRSLLMRATVSGAVVQGASAGCSGGAQTGGGGGGARTIGPATLEVAYNFTAFEQPYLEKHTQGFASEYPQIKVNWTSTQGDEHYTKLNTMLAGGTPPHMAHMTSR